MIIQAPTRYNKLGWNYLEWTGNLFHDGVDLNWGSGYDDFGQKVMSCAKGEVIYANFIGRGWGNLVWIKHTIELNEAELGLLKESTLFKDLNVKDSKLTFYARYGHLKSINCKVGDIVDLDTKIAELGGTGHDKDKQEFSPHLHLTFYKNKPKSWSEYTSGMTKEQVESKTISPLGFIDLLQFADNLTHEMSEWAVEASKRNEERGVITNFSYPREYVTLEKVSVIVDRLMLRIEALEKQINQEK